MNIFDAAARFFRGLHLFENRILLDPNGSPVMLAGRKSLDDLAERYGDEIVYHGSRNYIPLLEPRQMTWYYPSTGERFPDGAPAVGADAGYDIPTFMALFSGRRRCTYRASTDGTMKYTVRDPVTPEGQDLDSLVGYVHVLEKRHFEILTRDIPDGWPEPLINTRPPELRAHVPVRPLAVVKVTLDDFPHPITFE
ncbi:hypothetical protein [Actinoallomurus iriomotensis]|uniref:Uncharacterized protein n=1 Tax=Actinoallomurus iriomotensis TaxID=478107 RepID=A0A9W6RVP9_9ACTN|nr:hypothetical protein [Actinoallomurus iriomotensis]GLY83501.1 hypothetical protein Airi02_014310 [Actinoallomurus iriomotensis]